MRRNKPKTLSRPYPKGRQHTWSQQKTFMVLANRRQIISEPFLFGASNSLYGVADFTPRST